MADYTDYNDGIGGKGIIVAVILIGAFILALIFLGGSGPIENGSVAIDGALTDDAAATAPAADATAPAADATAPAATD